MGSIYHGRKTLLYSDLFKCNRNTVLEREEEEEENINMTKVEGIGSSSSLSSNKSFSCDSSSVGFSSPFGSELGSSESDDGDYMAELTRQMAECMLEEEEEEEEEKAISEDSEASDSLKDYKDKSCMDSSVINNLKYGLDSSRVRADDRVPLPPLEVYELKNEPAVRKERHVYRGKRVKGSESTHQKQVIEKREQQQHYHNYMQYRNGRRNHWRKESSSCMQAIFLDGSKSRNGSTGTGVFLPRVTDDPVKLKKKSGCSTVLIPTRVLQALELHFNRVSDSIAPPLSAASPNHSCRKAGESNELSKLENRPANHEEEMELPQEWTY